MANYDHRPPAPDPKWMVCTERESGQVIVAFKISPNFSANTYYRKGSFRFYSTGRWSYWSDDYYDNCKRWERSPYHKDFKEISAKTEEEAINEYCRTKTD